MSKLTTFGEPDPAAVEQIENVLKDERAVQGALMADCHKGYSMPIGGVVAYSDAISPSGVGFDIACGNMAVKTNINLSDVVPAAHGSPVEDDVSRGVWDAESNHRITHIKPIMRQIQKNIAFGMGRKNPKPIDHELFDNLMWPWLEKSSPGLKKKAADQLGTVGSGNHYVDLLVDNGGSIWVANHFGSRGLGHTIASGFMALSQNRDFKDRVAESEDAIVFNTDSDIGDYYIAAMKLAGEYAYAGREYVIEQVLQILGAKSDNTIHNHHNFAWKENDGKGNSFWVVRKGATPLYHDEPAFIGGSMGDVSVVVKRHKWSAVSRDDAIGSAPHGAGRVMSRTAAAGKMRKMWVCNNRECDWTERAMPGAGRATFEGIEFDKCPKCGTNKFRKLRMRDKSTARVDWDSERKRLNDKGIVVLGAGADESPSVYKDLQTVIAAHPNIEVLEILHPIGVVMAGADEHDPYKD